MEIALQSALSYVLVYVYDNKGNSKGKAVIWAYKQDVLMGGLKYRSADSLFILAHCKNKLIFSG